ncbi:VTT domain-containing protein [Sunxiuqinia sp. sy24]|uniref:VTT domain-containing protein n=1 Tax=Sunxiuqinia sp. sy24 TaxID=3461495 RepID=UPI0040464309
MKLRIKFKFLFKNILKGLLWMAVLAALYLLAKEYVVADDHDIWLERFYSRPMLIYGIYIGSEVFFGLFPPEIFMLWAYFKGDVWHYVFNIMFFAGVSYAAGYLAFIIGRYLRKMVLFRFLGRKFFSKYWPLFRKYGSFLIITAALTPLPWSLISMLVGSTEYPMKKYLNFALFRILRFGIYGYIIFQSHQFA